MHYTIIVAVIALLQKYNYGKENRRNNIPQLYLQWECGGPLSSIRHKILVHNADDLHVKLFRLNIRTYDLLLKPFQIVFSKSRMYRSSSQSVQASVRKVHGRPNRRICSADKALQIILRQLASGSNLTDLQLLSGTEGSVLSRTLHHSVACLLIVLRNCPAASMAMPSIQKAQKLAALAKQYLCRRGITLCGDFIGAVDGKIAWRERPGDDDWQNTNYNGKSNSHAAKILLVQLFDGTYSSSVVNYIGSAHDSRLASWLNFQEVMEHLPSNFVLAGDTAFGTSTRLIRPLSETEYATVGMNWHQLADCATILSKLRISSEWGVGAMVNTWRILRVPLPADDLNYGSMLWELCFRLSNVRVRHMCIGQVYNIFKE